MKLDIISVSLSYPRRGSGILFLVGLCSLLLTSCANVPYAKKHNPYYMQSQKVVAILANNGKNAEGSFYECLNTYYRQGLPYTQVTEMCSTRLQTDEIKGFGADVTGTLGTLGRGGVSAFDPGKVNATCQSGDPKLSRDPNPWSGPINFGQVTGNPQDAHYGNYSFGGKNMYVRDEQGKVVSNDQGSALVYLGLTKVESERRKQEAIDKAEAAWDEYENCTTDCDDEFINWMDLNEEAKADPNIGPFPVSRPAGGVTTACESVLEEAREILRECNRNGWKSAQCRQLAAQLNNCPDPTYAYIDPDQGYDCGAKIDPELVVKAVILRCRQLTRPGPDGRDPCLPPKVDETGRFIQGGSGSICNNPYAYISPDSNACITELKVDTFGQTDIQSIIVFGINVFGGPTVVIPRRGPTPPHPGPTPDPRPR